VSTSEGVYVKNCIGPAFNAPWFIGASAGLMARAAFDQSELLPAQLSGLVSPQTAFAAHGETTVVRLSVSLERRRRAPPRATAPDLGDPGTPPRPGDKLNKFL